MPVRGTMAAVITRLRDAISDPVGADQVWSDQQLQDALDRHRVRVRYHELTPVADRLPGGTEVTLFHTAQAGPWESDATLVDFAYASLTPSSTNLDLGEWTFAADTPGPVYVNGYAYDVAGAAVEILKRWAAIEKLNHDLAASGKNLSESQKFTMLLQLIAQYQVESVQWAGWALTGTSSEAGGIVSGVFVQTDLECW